MDTVVHTQVSRPNYLHYLLIVVLISYAILLLYNFYDDVVNRRQISIIYLMFLFGYDVIGPALATIFESWRFLAIYSFAHLITSLVELIVTIVNQDYSIIKFLILPVMFSISVIAYFVAMDIRQCELDNYEMHRARRDLECDMALEERNWSRGLRQSRDPNQNGLITGTWLFTR